MARTIFHRPVKLAVQYIRYSTEDQGSTDEQLVINGGLGVDHEATITATFGDEGMSRSISDRPGLMDLFAHLEAHRDVGWIIVNELERLTAGVGQRAEIARLCRRLQVGIITDDVGVISWDDDEMMQLADEKAVAAKAEVLKVRRRTRRNLRARVATSKIAVRPPFGIQMKPLVTSDGVVLPSGVSMLDARGKKVTSGELEIREDEYKWLVQIFNWADEGMGDLPIAKKLNELSVPTKTQKARGTTWKPQTIAKILSNPLYKGVYIWGAKRTVRDEDGKISYLERDLADTGRVERPSPLGPIIDVELWDRVNTRRQERKGERRRAKTIWPEQVLDGWVYCGGCGHKMYGSLDNASRYVEGKTPFRWRYHCSRTGVDAKPGFTMCTKRRSILADRIFETMIAASPSLPPMEATAASIGRSMVQLAEEQAKLTAEIAAAEESYKRSLEFAKEGLMPKDELVADKAKAEGRKAIAQERLAQLQEEARSERKVLPMTTGYRAQLRDLAERLGDDSLPLNLRRGLLVAGGIERVYFNDPGLRLDVRE